MDCRKTLVVDSIEFSIREVTLPKSAPLQEGKLIGFDFSFCTNRTEDIEDTLYSDLLCLYSEDEIDLSTEADYYIKSIDLYIDSRLKRINNFSAYDSNNKFHTDCLNKLIERNEEDFIRQWCIKDVSKRQRFKGRKYLEVFNPKDLFNQIRRAIYSLSYSFTISELEKSFYLNNRIKASYRNISIHNQLIYQFQPHIIEREKSIYLDPFKRRQHIDNTMGLNFKKEYELLDKDILINFRYSKKDIIPFTHFSPALIKAFIQEFDVHAIYDPCGGWGHRMLGSWDIKYIYNDIDTRTYNGCKSMYQFCSKFKKADFVFYNKDASIFTPPESYDCVFTCPPYFTTEKYTCEFTSTNKYPDYSEWINIWWRQLVKHNKVKYFAYVISDSYKCDMNKVLLEEGFMFVKEIQVSNYKSHLIKEKKNKETLQIFNYI